MAVLNVSLPAHIYAHVRAEYLHNLESHHGTFYPCVIFGAASQRNRALSFHILVDDGAQFAHVPLHALTTKPDATPQAVQDLCRWDCFGDEFTVTAFDYLKEVVVRAFLPSGPQDGQYLCSFDWLNNGFSDEPAQHKTMHLIALYGGNLALQPNNTLRWTEAAFTDRLFTAKPTYKTNTHKWFAEETGDEV